MSLRDYTGPANSEQMFPFLVGETIRGVFKSDGLYLVFEDGTAFALCTIGGGSPAYWKECSDEVRRKLERLRGRLAAVDAELQEVIRTSGLAELETK